MKSWHVTGYYKKSRTGKLFQRKVLRDRTRCSASKVEGTTSGACPTFFVIHEHDPDLTDLEQHLAGSARTLQLPDLLWQVTWGASRMCLSCGSKLVCRGSLRKISSVGDRFATQMLTPNLLPGFAGQRPCSGVAKLMLSLVCRPRLHDTLTSFCPIRANSQGHAAGFALARCWSALSMVRPWVAKHSQ